MSSILGSEIDKKCVAIVTAMDEAPLLEYRKDNPNGPWYVHLKSVSSPYGWGSSLEDAITQLHQKVAVVVASRQLNEMINLSVLQSSSTKGEVIFKWTQEMKDGVTIYSCAYNNYKIVVEAKGPDEVVAARIYHEGKEFFNPNSENFFSVTFCADRCMEAVLLHAEGRWNLLSEHSESATGEAGATS